MARSTQGLEHVEIYGLFCPETGELRYVGKARCAASRLKTHLADSKRKNLPISNWVRKLARNGQTPHMQVIVRCDESGWPHMERLLIAKHRELGARLLNLAPGGEQPLPPSKQVLAQNGVNSAANRDWRKWRVLQRLGKDIQRFDEIGDVKRGNMLRSARERFRTFTSAQREALYAVIPGWLEA